MIVRNESVGLSSRRLPPAAGSLSPPSDMNVYAKWKSDGAAIKAPAFTADGKNLFISVSNDTEVFSFIGQITVGQGGTWQISTDVYGLNVIPSKTSPLNVGDNTFYLIVTMGDDVDLYTVTVRRRPIYTVSFDTHGGSTVATQRVEENSLATAPPAATRAGYTFVNWAYDFNTPITQSQIITANWTVNRYTLTFNANGGNSVGAMTVTYDAAYTLPTPTGGPTGYTFAGWYSGNTQYQSSGTWRTASDTLLTAKWAARNDVSYKVKHYLQNFDNTYTLQSTQTLQGTADAAVTPETKTYTGFTAPQRQTVTVQANGSLIVEYYYTRNSYTMTFVTNGGEELAPVTQKYQSEWVLPTPTREGFTFGGWFTDVGLTTAPTAKVPAQNSTVYAWWQGENKPGNFTYSGTTAFTITKYKGTTTVVGIPAYIGGVPVAGIGESVFRQSTSLTSITIPDSVINIGDYAFYDCTSLTSVSIGNSVTSIGKTAFYGCIGLTSVTIPNSVTSIGDDAFCDCTNLTSITIGNGVTSIGNLAFYNCTNLTAVYITDIAKWCSISFYSNPLSYAHDFYVNSVLTRKLVIPNSVTSIGRSAFSGCTGLTSVTIPDSVTSIGEWAFDGCTSLTSVTIEDGVTSIGEYAFYNCTSLTDVIIPNSMQNIGKAAFGCCPKLVYRSYDNAKYLGNSQNPYVALMQAKSTTITSCTVHSDTKLIASCAFALFNQLGTALSSCTQLQNITIPEGVISVGDAAFYGCTGLTSITIPSSVVYIGEMAFGIHDETVGNVTYMRQMNLQSVIFAKGSQLTSIGSRAFYNCKCLQNLTIPQYVTCIGSSAFERCYQLADITFQGNKTKWNSISKGDRWNYAAGFGENNGCCIIHCTDGDISYYTLH